MFDSYSPSGMGCTFWLCSRFMHLSMSALDCKISCSLSLVKYLCSFRISLFCLSSRQFSVFLFHFYAPLQSASDFTLNENDWSLVCQEHSWAFLHVGKGCERALLGTQHSYEFGGTLPLILILTHAMFHLLAEWSPTVHARTNLVRFYDNTYRLFQLICFLFASRTFDAASSYPPVRREGFRVQAWLLMKT